MSCTAAQVIATSFVWVCTWQYKCVYVYACVHICRYMHGENGGINIERTVYPFCWLLLVEGPENNDD